MKDEKNSKTGSLGEEMACDFLLTRGHIILDRNWRGGHLEIDIVSESADGVHFVEVKTRTAPVLAPVEMQVNTTKRQRICNAALQYVHKKRLEGKEIFFDIISVLLDGPRTLVKYYPQAWIPIYV
jgi:putative endonuclease